MAKGELERGDPGAQMRRSRHGLFHTGDMVGPRGTGGREVGKVAGHRLYDRSCKNGRRRRISNLPVCDRQKDMKTPIRFHVDYQQAGRFIVHVYKVSVTSNLRILVDGSVAGEFPFDANPPKDPNVKPAYKSTTFVEQYHIYGAIFDTDARSPFRQAST